MEHFVRALNEAGVPLLVGTDCMSPSVVPGFSFHDELILLVDSGLTPYEVLKAATINASFFFTPIGKSWNGKRRQRS
jgi:imidazolonepropionase-like amidohydrolase